MKLEKKWILGPALILGLNAPSLVPASLPAGCASHDITEDPEFRRASEIAVDGVAELERPEFDRLLAVLERRQFEHEAEVRRQLEDAKDVADPLVPAPLQPLVDPAGELGLLVWFLLSERKNKKALEALKSAASR